MVENPMVIDSHWRHLEKEVRTFGECAGCEEDIAAGDDYFLITTPNEILKVHQNPECCFQYVGEMAWCKTAGNE
jgi:hypothetical protein